jgi:hypothetical protein
MRRASWLLGLALVACDDDGDRPQETEGDGGVTVVPEARVVDYIRGDRFPRLVIEVDAVPGAEPAPGVLDRLADGLGGLLDKPDGVEPVFDAPLEADDGRVWTFDDLETLAAATYDLDVPPDTVKMHLLFVDGRSAGDEGEERILGIAWDFTHVAIFTETLRESCEASGIPPALFERVCAAVELGVVTHEVGHLLGLVDFGLPMVAPHADPEHPGHDRNEECIMFWTYEGQGIVDALERRMWGDVPDLGFDDACRADIAAVRDAP